MVSDSRLRLVRIRLVTVENIVPGNVLEIVLGQRSPQIILGANGAGKSLLVASLRAFDLAEFERRGATQELYAAGVRELQCELAAQNLVGHGRLNFATNERMLTWTEVPKAWERIGEDEGIYGAEELAPSDRDQLFFDEIHTVERGRLSLILDRELIDSVRVKLAAPLERELKSWNERLNTLAGADGSGGRLQEAQRDLDAAELRLEHVRGLHDELERNRQRSQELTVRAADLVATSEMLKAEQHALADICRQSERAERLEKWIRELEATVASAGELREKISQIEASLHHLDKRYADSPHNLPELVRSYVSARDQAAELRTQVDILEQDRELALRTVKQIRSELDSMSEPQDSEFRALTETMRREIAALDQRLTEIHRGRIELIRKREGIESAFHPSTPELAALDEQGMQKLLHYFELKSDNAVATNTARVRVIEQQKLSEQRITDLRSRLQVQFAEYDKLPVNTPDLLKELADRRRILATLMSDVEQLNVRKEVSATKINPSLRAMWAGLIALFGFSAGTYFQGWDIGLFVAVLLSGATLLLFKSLNKGAEQALDSVTGALTLSESRLREVRERVDRLEKQLHPLSSIGHLDEALQLYASYNSLSTEYKESARGTQSATPEISPLQKQLEVLERELPANLRLLSADAVRAAVSLQYEQRSKLQELDRQWQEYGEQGKLAVEARQIEEKLATLKNTLQQADARQTSLIREFREKKAEAELKVAQLELSASGKPMIQTLQAELTTINNRMSQLGEAIGEVLNEVDPETLELEWQARANQRTELQRLDQELKRLPATDELRARCDLLREEFNDIRQRLLELDPLYLHEADAKEYAAKYRRQLRDASQAIEENLAAIGSTQQELREIQVDAIQQAIAREPALDLLAESVQEHSVARDTLKREVEATQELRDAVKTEIQEANRDFDADLAAGMSAELAALSDGALTQITVHDGQLMVAAPGGMLRAASALSEGAADLAGLAARIAILQMLRGTDVGPVIWDEPFSRLDDRRTARVRERVSAMSESRQVIVLTRDQRFSAWGEPFVLQGETWQGAARESF